MYTVWMCCKDYDQYDTKEEAFDWAHSTNESYSGHRVIDVEGPNGEDLTEEFEIYDRIKSHESTQYYMDQQKKAKAKLIGWVDVKSPEDTWCPQAVYSVEQRDKIIANGIAAYGHDRVQFRPKS